MSYTPKQRRWDTPTDGISKKVFDRKFDRVEIKFERLYSRLTDRVRELEATVRLLTQPPQEIEPGEE